MENYGSLIKMMRESQDLSLRDIQNATGISDSVQSRIENNRPRSLNLGVIKKLAKYYHMSKLDFLINIGFITKEELEEHNMFADNIASFSVEDISHIQRTINYIARSKRKETRE